MDKVLKSIQESLNWVVRFFQNEQTAIVNYVVSNDTSLFLSELQAVAFINRGTNSVQIDRITLNPDDTLSYSADAFKRITQTFEITFSDRTGGNLLVTTIK